MSLEDAWFVYIITMPWKRKWRFVGDDRQYTTKIFSFKAAIHQSILKIISIELDYLNYFPTKLYQCQYPTDLFENDAANSIYAIILEFSRETNSHITMRSGLFSHL